MKLLKKALTISDLQVRPNSLDLLRKPSRIMGKPVVSPWLKLEQLRVKQKLEIIGAG